MQGTRGIYRFLCVIILSMPLLGNSAIPFNSMVVFGDSLSDTGNTTRMLKSLNKDENPDFLVRPFKAFVLNKMVQFANDYHVPDVILDAGIAKVSSFFDNGLGPMLVNLIAKIQKVPLLPGEPYWESRFSNGPVWNEYLAPMLAIKNGEENQFVNMAYAGSWAATYDHRLTVWNLIRHPLQTLKNVVVGKLIPPSLGLSLQAYLMDNPILDSRNIYFLFSGANDYVNVLQFGNEIDRKEMSLYIDNVVNSIDTSVKALAKAGAEHIVIINIPPVGSTPRFLNTEEASFLNASIEKHNKRIEKRLAGWEEKMPRVKFTYVDVNSYFEKARQTPEAYGFTNVDEPCIDVKLPLFRALSASPFAKNFVLNYAHTLQYRDARWAMDEKNYTVCEAPDTYLFWDEIHPNTRVHQYLALEVCDVLKANGYAVTCQLMN
jgi:phospholipase/lecithinase/hemolysin